MAAVIENPIAHPYHPPNPTTIYEKTQSKKESYQVFLNAVIKVCGIITNHVPQIINLISNMAIHLPLTDRPSVRCV